MKGLILIGGGGHCKSVIDTLINNKSNDYDDIVITDACTKVDTFHGGIRVVGDDSLLQPLYDKGYAHAFITIGGLEDMTKRYELRRKAAEIGFELISVVDNTAIVSETCTIGKGVFVGKNAVINAGAVVGDMSIINTGAIVEHECKIGDYSHCAVGSVLCGCVSVGKGVLIGAGATVIQGVRIGDKAIVGAGAVVIDDIVDEVRVMGVPAKVVQ